VFDLLSDEQVSQIAASIGEFGFTNPILFDGTNGIIAGHGRLAAARLLELKTVPCIELGHLSEAQKRAYIIAANKLALNGGWSEDILRRELTDLKALGANPLLFRQVNRSPAAPRLRSSRRRFSRPGGSTKPIVSGIGSGSADRSRILRGTDSTPFDLIPGSLLIP
jgi:ParB-like chromosome segregation protein Spo0J